MKKLLFTCILFLLSSCLLKQEDPNLKNNKGEFQFAGNVYLEEMKGYIEEAQFLAVFGKLTPGVEAFRKFKVYGSEIDPSRDTTPTCEIKSQANSRAASTFTLLDVGVLDFGLAFQDIKKKIVPDSNNQYSLTLDAGLASGLYDITVPGANGFPAYHNGILLPQEITEATVNGVQFEDGLPFMADSEIKLQWKMASPENSKEFVLLYVRMGNKNETVVVNCEAREQTLDHKDGVKMWTLGKEFTSKFPSGSTGAIYLTRLRMNEDPNTELRLLMRLNGMRTLATPVIMMTE